MIKCLWHLVAVARTGIREIVTWDIASEGPRESTARKLNINCLGNQVQGSDGNFKRPVLKD